MFDSTDTDKDQKLSLDEVLVATKKFLKEDTPKYVVTDTFDRYDGDKDGFLEFEEFLALSLSNDLHEHGDHEGEHIKEVASITGADTNGRKRIENLKECSSKSIY
jgi:hypothetical protein